MPVDSAAPIEKLLVKGLPVSEAHDQGDAITVGLILRQHLRLSIIDGLQRMFGVAQKLIAFAQLFHGSRRQIALPGQGCQHLEQWALLQAKVAPSMDKLESLGDELHLADATGAQLDVGGHAFAPDLLLDQLFHRAQRIDCGKIKIAPIDEGPEHFQQLFARRFAAADHARLDHGVAFPVAPLILVVLLQRIEAQHQRAGRAIGPQSHVHAKDETIDCRRVERLDQPLPEANEELLVIQRALCPNCLAAFWIAKDQVDIRGQIQFTCAQLAHAKHNHVLGIAAASTSRNAKLLAVALV